ncbi:MAG: discoidin domain-containing protein, partial [Planctomycetaceae bacterium]|nr:discoidin domain-containing protein [Planctomycetaceae bacterium]
MFNRFIFCFTLFPLSLCAAADVKTVAVQLFADSENDGYEVYRAMDGNAETMWHTQFSAAPQAHHYPHPVNCGYDYACGYDHPGLHAPGFMSLPIGVQQLPWIQLPDDDHAEDTSQSALFGIVRRPGNSVAGSHALGIDLGGVYPLTGFRYTPRIDSGNGTFGKYEIYATEDCRNGKAVFGEPIAAGTFSGQEKSYTINFGKTVEARYLKFVSVASLNGDPFGSIAECQPIAAGYRFVASRGESLSPDAKNIARIPDVSDDPELQERINEWNLLAERFKTPYYWDAIKDEVASPASLILPEDNDPLDVIVRRFNAMEGNDSPIRVSDIPVEDVSQRFDEFCRIADMRRSSLLQGDAGPLKYAPQEYLFIKRHRSTYNHMCDQFYGRSQPSGGGLFVLNVETGEVRNLLENSVVESGRLKGQKLDKGAFLSPDVSLERKKIAFAYVECEGELHRHIDTLDVTRGHSDIGRSYHIFTCNADGSNLRQITDGTWNDFDPCWLPNGRMAFISERRNGYL